MLLAGIAVERKLKGEQLDAALEVHSDAKRARRIVEWMLADNLNRVDGYIRGELTTTTDDFLDTWQQVISDVVAASQAAEVLDADGIRVIVEPAVAHRRKLQAYHEAGHAVSLWLEGDGQIPLSVGLGKLPGESGQNFTVLRPFSREFYERQLATDAADLMLAQRSLERVVAGEEIARLIDEGYPGAVLTQSDRQQAARLARKLSSHGREDEAKEVEANARATVRDRFQAPKERALVDALACALLMQSPLGQEEIYEVFKVATQAEHAGVS